MCFSTVADRIMRFIAAALLVLLAAPAAAADEVSGSRPVALPDYPLHLAQIDDRKAVFATVETIRRTMARARIGGTVGELAVTEGDLVQAGQKLAAVGDAKLLMQLDANEQRMRSQEAQRDQAESDLRRAKELFPLGAVAKITLEQAQTALLVAERGLSALKAERAVTSQQLAEGAVLAPTTGRVLSVPVSLGSVVMPGETIANIATRNYVLRAQIPERHARFIKTGDTVSVGDDEVEEPLGLQGKALFRKALQQGTVTKVYPELKDGRVTADIEVAGLDDYFVGERVKVWVSTGRRAGLVLPEFYLHRRYGLTFARLKDGTEVVVQTGPVHADGVEVLTGLRDGDIVVAP